MATEVDTAQRDAFAERLFGAALGAYELMTVHLGDRLGYYRALAEHGSATSAELAAATGTDERYAREWLEQQAVAGILEVDDAGAAAAARRFSLPAGHAEVLCGPRLAGARDAAGPLRRGLRPRPPGRRGGVPQRRRGVLGGLRPAGA